MTPSPGLGIERYGVSTQPPTKTRPEDQALPTKNELPIIQDLVLQDIQDRLKLGIQRYGTGLQPFNGRDSLKDAYEEALDLAIYLRQLIWERDHPELIQ